MLHALAGAPAAVPDHAVLQPERSSSVADERPRPACQPDTRLLLTLAPAAFHGSTGLLQMLMSSPNVHTLCNGAPAEGSDPITSDSSPTRRATLSTHRKRT